MKKLICAKDIETAKEEGQEVFYVDWDTIITPLAKDAAITYGIEISKRAKTCNTNSSKEGTSHSGKVFDGEIDKDVIYKFFKTLMDKGLLNEVLDLLSEKPYVFESDCGGLKLVRGNSVKFDAFDTGNPNDKVLYQELIGKDNSSMSAGFLTIDHSNFNWELDYEEIDYVIEGTLTVTINGKTFTAYPGDVLYVPSGSKVVWGSPDKAKLFYIAYPAN